MHLLPLTLGHLADATDPGSGSESTGSIHVQLYAEGAYTLEATDCKQAIRVQGALPNATEYPISEALDEAPGGSTEALIPAKAWKKFFADANKLTKKVREPLLRSVAVKLGDGRATLSATDWNSNILESTETAEGRFPALTGAFPSDPPLHRVTVDAVLAAKLLKVIAATCPGEGTSCPVEFEFYGDNKPIVIRTKSVDLKIDALLCPLK